MVKSCYNDNFSETLLGSENGLFVKWVTQHQVLERTSDKIEKTKKW